MIDELTWLRAAFETVPDPAPDVVAQARRNVLAGLPHEHAAPSSNEQEELARGVGRGPRRLSYLTSGLAAVAVAVVAIGVGVRWDAGTRPASGDDRSTASAPATLSGRQTPATLSGRQILLAAATVAEKAPARTGTYWHVKVVSTTRNGDSGWNERWVAWDGRMWARESDGKITQMQLPNVLALGVAHVTIGQLQALPTQPAALKARVADLVSNGDAQAGAGKLTVAVREHAVFEGLVSLVSQLPASPKVRAAALRAIAAYPNVTSLGAVDGGQGLRLSFWPGQDPPASLVIDPATGQLRRTNVLVGLEGGLLVGVGYTWAVTTAWTDVLPR